MNSSNYQTQQDWHVLGAGAIGCLWAFHLAQANHKVTLLLRNHSRLEEFDKTKQIILESGKHQAAISVEAEISSSSRQPINNLLVCTKSFDVTSAIQSVIDRISPNTQIILLINGMGAQQECAARFEKLRFVWGVGNNGVFRRNNFHLVLAGVGPTYFGQFECSKENDNGAATSFRHSMTGVSLETNWESDIQTQMWKKLSVNCAINALTAIHNCRNGELLDNSKTIDRMEGICQEITEVMLGKKITMSAVPLFKQALEVAKLTATNYSSMQQDILWQRKTEIEHMNGYICKVAAEIGISVPENTALCQQIRELSASFH